MFSKRVFITAFCFLFSFALPASAAGEGDWQSPHELATLQGAKTPLIPFPRNVAWGTGDFVLPKEISVKCPGDVAEKVAPALRLFEKTLRENGATQFTTGTAPAAIIVEIDESVSTVAEGYALEISATGIRIRGRDAAGVFYAMQTLRQMLRNENAITKIQCAKISDWPAFPMRGFMHDTGRNFQTVESLKTQLDKFAAYKLNVFHWHLTDYPAWRPESKIFPQLGEAKFRKAGRDENSGYTFDEIRSVIAYARDRHILVIPELDMPGHSDYFKKTFGFDMASPEGQDVLEKLLEEFCSEIPATDCPRIHIGSDEVRIKNPKEFMTRMLAKVRSLGRDTMTWNPGLPADDATLEQLWADGLQDKKNANNKAPYVDSAGGYLNTFDAVGMVQRQFLTQFCALPAATEKARGAILCCWPDARVDDKAKIFSHNGVWPAMLAFSESIWCGRPAKPGKLVASLPAEATGARQLFGEFEKRLCAHRDKFFAGEAFPYAAQSHIVWRVSDPFLIQKNERIDAAFEPETRIADTYEQAGKTLRWHEFAGGTVTMRDRANAGVVGKIVRGTVYALTYVYAENPKTIYARIGFETPARSSRQGGGIPPAGKWDAHGGTIFVNDKELPAPTWKNPGKYRHPEQTWFSPANEIPFEDEEFYWVREPSPVALNAGWNKVLMRVPCEFGNQNWTFAFTPVKKSAGGHWIEDESVLFSTSSEK